MPALMSIVWPDFLATTPACSPLPFELNSRHCHRLDLRGASTAVTDIDPADTASFSAWIDRQIQQHQADYAAGGYGEDRELYRMSAVFGVGADEARTLHLGVDLWIQAGTPIHAVLPGSVHSTADNHAFGDYGPTVILEHHSGGLDFFTLYGHLARRTLAHVRPGQRIAAGEHIGWLGDADENGGWPPHLHFQIVRDPDGALGGRSGDYPGVCKPSERELWLARCPNPNLLLRIDALS